MADTWYVQDGDSEAIGPVTTELLIDGIRAGRVLPSARLCRVGGTDWTPLATHPLFSKVIREVAPPPPVAASSGSPAGVAPATTAQPLPPRPPMAGARTSTSRTMVIAGAGVLLLIVGVVGLRRHLAAVRAEEQEQRRRADPLYIACIDKLPSELAGAKEQEFSCSGGTLTVTSFRNYTALFFHDGRPGLPAGKVRSYVKAVFPNLGEPTRSAGLPCRHVMALNLKSDDEAEMQLATAVQTYKMAEGVVEILERWGGDRYATWKVGAGGVVVENHLGDGDPIILRVYPGALPDAPGEVTNVAWTDEPTCLRTDTPELLSLRLKMMADGWWFDDAAAFMAAAKAVGHAEDDDTARQLGIVAHFLSASKGWDDIERVEVAWECLAPAVQSGARGVAAPFDVVSGVDASKFVLVASPRSRTKDGAWMELAQKTSGEPGRFDAMIRSPAHARCALDHFRSWAGSARDGIVNYPSFVPLWKIASIWEQEKATPKTWQQAWSLAFDAHFATVLHDELARARAHLVSLADAPDAGVPASTTEPSPSASSPTPKAAAGGSLTTSGPPATLTAVPTATPTTTATATTTAAPEFDPY